MQDTLSGFKSPWFYGLAIVCWGVFCYIKALKGGDFDVYLDAAGKLLEGDNIYAPPFAKGLQYYYSVAFALFLGLFVDIPIIAKFLWLVFSSWCVYRSWQIMNNFLQPKKLLPPRTFLFWQVIVFIVAARFLLYNFITLQLTLFLLWACLESVYQSYQGKEFRAGVLLGVAINIKLLPLVVLPYLIYRSYYKAAALTLFTIVFLFFFPSLFIGFEENKFLLGEWVNIVNPFSAENSLKGNKLMHSLAAVIPAYLMEPIDGFTGPRNLAAFSEETIKLLINGARGVLILLSLYFLRWPPFQKKTLLHIWWEVAYLLLIVPLIFPHQQKYSFWFILPAVAYIALALLLKSQKQPTPYSKWLFLSLLISISPIIGRDILGTPLYDALQYYKILSLVTLCFIPFLVTFTPEKLSTVAPLE